jgi:transposase
VHPASFRLVTEAETISFGLCHHFICILKGSAMSHPDVYRDFFLLPSSPRHRHYEILRARFVDHLPVQEIARRFGVSFYTAQSQIRDFKRNLRQGTPPSFFLTLAPGPKRDRRKSKVREQILALRARGYASTDIHKALARTDQKVSLSLIDQILNEEGLSGIKRRTRDERERITDEIRSGHIPPPM